jgi:protease IV
MLRQLLDWWRRPSFSIDDLPLGQVDPQVFTRALARDMLADRRATRRAGLLKPFVYGIVVLLPAVFLGWPSGTFDRPGPTEDVVGLVELDGEMADGKKASADRVIPALRKAFESSKVRAVLVSIDSPGGSPLEAERIYSAIESWRQSHPKPVACVINNIGASAAYMVALHCDQIYAGKYSLVGSVGAVLSGWDFHRALERVDVGQRVYASGNLKGMLNPYLAMSPEAEIKARDLVSKMGQQFRHELETQRSAKLAKGVDFGSGELWGGIEALQLGLIDEVATLDQVAKQRWPDLKVHGFGPAAPTGLPMLGASVMEALRELSLLAPGAAHGMSVR